MNSSKSKMRHIQEANILLERRMLILKEDNAAGEWLSYQNDKNYQYKKVGNDWIAKNVKTNKEFNLTQLSTQPKFAGYKKSIESLEATFPGGKPKADANATVDANANSNVNATVDPLKNNGTVDANANVNATVDPTKNNATINANVGDNNAKINYGAKLNPFQFNNPLNNTLNTIPQIKSNNSNPLLNKFNSQNMSPYDPNWLKTQNKLKSQYNTDMSGSINNPQNATIS